MARTKPERGEKTAPVNTAVLLREAFFALNGQVTPRLAERGHSAVRPAHGAVFQYLDDAGTTVSALADRAEMTKQAMGELVAHLEQHGYVERMPDPSDRRAKLVRPTAKGREVYAIVTELVPELEKKLLDVIGVARVRQLRSDLEKIHDTFAFT